MVSGCLGGVRRIWVGYMVSVWRGWVGGGRLWLALTVEGPEVVIPQVHQVLQGGVELLHNALGPQGKRREGGEWERKKE